MSRAKQRAERKYPQSLRFDIRPYLRNIRYTLPRQCGKTETALRKIEQLEEQLGKQLGEGRLLPAVSLQAMRNTIAKEAASQKGPEF